MSCLQGKFLIASPHLSDPNFARSVVLMIEHHDEGALGVVINRESQVSVGAIWEQLNDSKCDCQVCMSLGGPVQGPMIALHGHPQFSESEIVPGVYLATQREYLADLISQDLQPLRIFTGYAGWGAGQLESEIQAGGWLTHCGSAEHVFSDDLTSLWQVVLRSTGQDFLRDTLGISHFPSDAGLN